LPWTIIPKDRRRPGPIARFRSDHERRIAWTAGGFGLLALLAFWFALASQLA
jgi:hypothetical protein